MIGLFTHRQRLRQAVVDAPQRLRDIVSADVNLTVWKRPVQEDIDLLGRFILRQGLPAFQESVVPENAVSRLRTYLENIPFSPLAKQLLLHDVRVLLDEAFALSAGNRVKLILKTVADDACTKFHTDGYDYRLLCTYVGEGTEWVPDAYVNRAKLVKGTNTEIVTDLLQVQRLSAFDVAILKGEASHANRGKGIVHRSPTIEATGDLRWLLRVDI